MTSRPEQTTTVTQGGERRAAHIESLRALGAIAIVLTHLTARVYGTAEVVPTLGSAKDVAIRLIFAAGNAGLFIFFAISGYVLFMPFAKWRLAGGNPVRLGRYAVNRALRLLPLYYLILILTLAVDYGGASTGTWFKLATFSQNFDPDTVFKFLGQSWTLVIDVHFYLLLPVIAWLVARLARGSMLRAGAIIVVLGLGSLAFRILEIYLPNHPGPLWRASIVTNFLFIAAGMLAAIVHLAWDRGVPSRLRGLARNSDVWLLAALIVILPYALYANWFDFLGTVFGFLLIAATSFPGIDRARVTSLLWWRPLAVLGLATYSIYLWHILVIHFLVDNGVVSDNHWLPLAATAVPLTIAVALVSYRVIEEPFLRLRRQWSRSSAATDRSVRATTTVVTEETT